MMALRVVKPRRIGLGLIALFLLGLAGAAHAEPAASCEQIAANYDYVLGTQAFGSGRKLPEDPSLMEQAKEIRALGSNVLKISLGRGQARKFGFADASRKARTTLEYIKAAKGLQKVIDLDFHYYQFWVHTYTGGEWRDGVSNAEAKAYYDEMYDLTAWLLKRYSGSGKIFMLGNWEGDWLLNGRQGGAPTPSRQAIQGMIDWLNIRQKAVDDAKARTPHHGVEVYHYVEVNLVKRALEGQASVALSVLPETNVDLVSYSSYEAIKQSKAPDIDSIRGPLTRIVHFLQGQLKPKSGLPFANRVFIGEYGYHARSDEPLSIEQQFMKSRYVMQVAIELDMPFALIWQLYNNEFDPNGNSANMGLLEDSGQKRALYFLHRQFLQSMTDWVASSCRNSGQPPARDVFRARALDLLPTLTFERMEEMARSHVASGHAPAMLMQMASDRGRKPSEGRKDHDD